MDADRRVYVVLSGFGEKIPVFSLGSKIFLSRTQLLTSDGNKGYQISFSFHLSSISSRVIELTSLKKREIEHSV